MTDSVPAPIQALVDATNDAFVALFSEDAFVKDFGREFHGPEGAASWDETDNIGVGAQYDFHGVRPGENEGDYYLDVTITSRRFNGDASLDIGVRDGKITRLVTG